LNIFFAKIIEINIEENVNYSVFTIKFKVESPWKGFQILVVFDLIVKGNFSR